MGQLLLVRHGQASFGADDYDVLSETGWEQGRALGRWLADAGVRPTALVRGGMRRHRETLEAITAAAGWERSDPVVDDGWDEFDHVGLVAAFAGQSGEVDVPLEPRAFQQLFERATARWTAGEGEGYAETYAAFVARVRGALVRARAAAGSGETVLAVTSGGPIGVAMACLVDPEEERPEALARLWSSFNTVSVNAGLTRVVVGSTGARMLTFNEHSHLGGELLTYR